MWGYPNIKNTSLCFWKKSNLRIIKEEVQIWWKNKKLWYNRITFKFFLSTSLLHDSIKESGIYTNAIAWHATKGRIFVRILVLRLRDIYTLMVLAYNNFLDRHLGWRSLDPTLDISSDFVKKKKKSIPPPFFFYCIFFYSKRCNFFLLVQTWLNLAQLGSTGLN